FVPLVVAWNLDSFSLPDKIQTVDPGFEYLYDAFISASAAPSIRSPTRIAFWWARLCSRTSELLPIMPPAFSKTRPILGAAAGITAVEAYHAAEIRTLIGAGSVANPSDPHLHDVNKVSALRAI